MGIPPFRDLKSEAIISLGDSSDCILLNGIILTLSYLIAFNHYE